MAGTAAKGTKFKIGATAVAQLTSIDGVKLSADTVDVTDLGNQDGYREFIGGFKDGGEVVVSGYFAYASGGQDLLYTNFESGVPTTMSIEFPVALNCKWTFQGVCTAYETGAEVEEAVSFDATVKVSGKPLLSAITG